MNINSKLKEAVKERLCPDEQWKFSQLVESLLKRKINNLPERNVTDEETRYPLDFAGMRTFLEKFFARHYFQVQNSLLDYVTSDDFTDRYNSGKLNILDIGSGPAIASLAVIDMLNNIFGYTENVNPLRKLDNIHTNIVLNDAVKVCLGTRKELLQAYFKSTRCDLSKKTILQSDKEFPSNIKQLKRIANNYGKFDLVILSYVIIPLSEQDNIEIIADAIRDAESFSNRNGRILILQDRFRKNLVDRLTKAIGREYKKEELIQQVYSPDNSNEYHKYEYFSCLFSPEENHIEKSLEPVTR